MYNYWLHGTTRTIDDKSLYGLIDWQKEIDSKKASIKRLKKQIVELGLKKRKQEEWMKAKKLDYIKF